MGVDNWLRHQDLGRVINSPDFGAYRSLYENVMMEPYDVGPERLEADWMASPPHRANILRSNVNVVGIGVFHGADGRLWAVVDFGGI